MIANASRILTGLILLWSACTTLAAYPQNPLLQGDAIYVSHQGVFKFVAGRAEPLWSSLTGVETFAPVIENNRLLVGSTQGLYALDPARGKVIWHIEKSRTIFTPSVSARAFAGSLHGELYALDPRQGTITWRRQFPGWIYSPAINEASASLWAAGQAHRIYAIASIDGRLTQQLESTQESVFSPIDIGDNRIAVNLFDGSTTVIDAQTGEIETRLAGSAQPVDLQARGNFLYRSHRDGNLEAFIDRRRMISSWRKKLVSRNLSMHPARPGYLLLSDLDRKLILLDIGQTDNPCKLELEGKWLLPLQLTAGEILYFRKNLQPPGISLVQFPAKCQ